MDQGESFSQQSPVWAHIQHVLRQYPDSALLRELCQNADDAKATLFRVILDKRSHRGHFEQAIQEPALLHPDLWVRIDE